ncbi:hypothetical protein HELRODRAFT_161981 [Helobdella robusta]|uniref:MGAT4 conserved region domain-containing protein n=1 Tax=Helobdella robusta TaxID=6412 RepID=T1ES43_HELRO|nr:hypothetical protein HELRODRAFT_161981 [Helobdella robusta]ESO02689.1 hypothetical protein HELRODRAFT_161981 [Helobdella robusta]
MNPDLTNTNDLNKYLHVTVFLTIGIPSIKRVINATYLLKTLEFLILRTSDEQKLNTTCVILLSDLDDNYNILVENQIKSLFPNYLNSGFFHVLRVDKMFYPQLNGLKRNFNDAEDRISWRAKQVLDYTILFRYSSTLSHYHMQIEDDVECGLNYYKHIKYFIEALHFKSQMISLKQFSNKTQYSDLIKDSDPKRNSDAPSFSKARIWSILDFSVLGFIGKLLRSTDLNMLSTFLATFYDEQPVDWLIVYWIKNMGANQMLSYKPSLFQHFGLRSSFNFRQDNKLKDKYFLSQPIDEFRANPLAVIYSNMTSTNKMQAIEDVYIPSDKFIFELSNKNSLMVVNFLKPESIENIKIFSGPIGGNQNVNDGIVNNAMRGSAVLHNNNKSCFQNLFIYTGKTPQKRPKINGELNAVPVCDDLKSIGRFQGCLIEVKISEKDCECVTLGVQELPNPVLVNKIVINSN